MCEDMIRLDKDRHELPKLIPEMVGLAEADCNHSPASPMFDHLGSMSDNRLGRGVVF
jgi:hypothetical protein